MTWINRKWTAREADEWRKEDTLAVIISPIVYVLLLLGPALAMLLIPSGFLIITAGIMLTALLVWIINPKLSALSRAFEKRQHIYLEELERRVKWEDQ